MTSKKIKKLDCFKCMFKETCIFNDLDLTVKKEWNSLKKPLSCENRHLVYKEGEAPDNIFIVCAGRVKTITTDSTGQQMITWIRHPGKIFGHVAFFSDRPHYTDAECMGKTTVSAIAGKSFKKLLKSYPKLPLLFLKRLSNDVCAMQINLKDTAYKPAKVKIANTLLKSISFSSKDTASPTIHGLKRIEIAEITGLALETVVRALAAMEKSKIIKRETKSIKILDLAKLNKISDKYL
ncbi:MAG: Crp/Fnr family transcriptional regulator [Elusimicrobiota bacterium]|nr:Crp/Fnr family transcriptional regulator [Elusimicrobiota bacterium]